MFQTFDLLSPLWTSYVTTKSCLRWRWRVLDHISRYIQQCGLMAWEIFFCFVSYFFPVIATIHSRGFFHYWKLYWCLKIPIIITTSSLSCMEIGSLGSIVLDSFSPGVLLHIYYIEWNLSSYCLLSKHDIFPQLFAISFHFYYPE